MRLKRLFLETVEELHREGLNATQIGEILGCSGEHVRQGLVLLGRAHGRQAVEMALERLTPRVRRMVQVVREHFLADLQQVS